MIYFLIYIYIFYFRYNLMKKCWHVQPEKRPTFEFCLKFLKSYYMVLEYINNRDTELQIIPEYLNL